MDRIEPGQPITPLPLVTKSPSGQKKEKREQRDNPKDKKDVSERDQIRVAENAELDNSEDESADKEGVMEKGTKVDIQI